MFDISAGAAFLAGLVSFITPCVLPIVPPYLAYIAGVSFSELKGENTDGAVSRGVNRRVSDWAGLCVWLDALCRAGARQCSVSCRK